jgi:hypothetical protein
MARKRKRPERKHKHPKKPPKFPAPSPDDGSTQQAIEESSQYPQMITTAPADQQAGLQPQDYPNDQAAFSTGPGQAVQYNYSRQDLFNEQYAQEQVAAAQNTATAGSAAVPGPGQVGVSAG